MCSSLIDVLIEFINIQSINATTFKVNFLFSAHKAIQANVRAQLVIVFEVQLYIIANSQLLEIRIRFLNKIAIQTNIIRIVIIIGLVS